ncbi:hypothetical protein CBR_g45194 [Chara braunii]|uniref:DUF659 domain-containing protein n=1 Tax=Chara braunii TaxID=69332 RepID=A0A388K378_CHABU|nr:hypothetical protein CBR_g45194 [Chara braunii]|eukprot:GBG64498.1 hypothetical protein CBR_g45194 [Chara braunii]
MVQTQTQAFEDAGEDENRKAQKKCCVYKYICVEKNLGERFHGNRMLKCFFCGHEFQGNQFVAGRHFWQGKGCPKLTDEALVDIHYNTDYKLDGKILERMRRFEELHSPAPAMDPRRDEGGLGQERDDEDVIDVDNVVEETVVRTADDVAADLAEVRAPFHVTGATILSEGRKSRDAKPIVNFLVGGSRGVMLVQTMNREGERDRAEDVLAWWIKVFDDFPPKWLNAICIDSASAYVAAANMLDRGGLHMSRVVQWTQDVTREVAQEVCVLLPDSAHFIVQKVQARCAHMLEPAHPAAHLLCPSRWDLRYYEGVVSDYDASLVREAKVYISSQTGFDVVSPEYETACAQMRDFHTRRGSIAWGGRDGDRKAQRCTDNVETYEAGCWWSKWGQCAPQLQAIALRVMYMWTCSSRAERNWAVHEGVQTKKRNRLEFEKVAKLVEISTNVRLLSHQRAGRGFALPWTLDEPLLDVEAGIGTRPSWKGMDDRRTQEELECQRRSWQRDPCGSRAPLGEVADVFGTRAATLRPYPRDDDNDYEGREQEDERAGPTTATTATQEVDEWSDPEDVRRRSGGDDFFVGVDLEGEVGLGGRYGSPVERQRPTSPVLRSAKREGVHASAPSRGAESGCGGPVFGQRLHRLVKGPRQQLEERLAGGSSPVLRDERDREGAIGGHGGA